MSSKMSSKMSLKIVVFSDISHGLLLGPFWDHLGSRVGPLLVLLGRPWGALGGLGAVPGAPGRSWDSLG